jgi:hypothetical protein
MTYDFKLTLKKVGIAAVEVIVAGLISYFTTNNIAFGLALIPLFEGIRNYFKNKNK